MSSILRSSKTRFTQGRLFYTQGPLFCALVREEAIFAVCKPCANERFACMCKNKPIVQCRVGREGQTDSLVRLKDCVKEGSAGASTKESESTESQMQSKNLGSGIVHENDIVDLLFFI